MEAQLERTVADTRRFHRFYLPYFHLLSQKYLDSDYSAAEARILYELFYHPGGSATDIIGKLHIDKGYLSRVLKRLADQGFLQKEASRTDARRLTVSLTEKGNALTERLIAESNRQIARELAGLSDEALAQLSCHMDAIMRILGETGNEDH